MHPKALILAALSALALSSCNGVPISTQWKLRNFDLGATDLSTLRVALRAPEWTTPTPDKTVIVASLGSADASGAERQTEIHLQRAAHAEDAAEIARLSPKSGSIAFYEIAAKDLAAARALQAEAQKRKRDGVGPGGGKVSVDRGVVCRRGDTPDGPILIDVLMHPDDAIGWLPLFEDFDVRALLKTADDVRKFEEGAPLCEKHAKRVEAQK